jgi:dihydroxyacetone kinase-like predicted kinase
MTTLTTALQGSDLREAMLGAEAYMELYRDAANALNVFPVPDGDTGTNMLLTLRAGVERMDQEADATSAGEVAESIATGAFWGARGRRRRYGRTGCRTARCIGRYVSGRPG